MILVDRVVGIPESSFDLGVFRRFSTTVPLSTLKRYNEIERSRHVRSCRRACSSQGDHRCGIASRAEEVIRDPQQRFLGIDRHLRANSRRTV